MIIRSMLMMVPRKRLATANVVAKLHLGTALHCCMHSHRTMLSITAACTCHTTCLPQDLLALTRRVSAGACGCKVCALVPMNPLMQLANPMAGTLCPVLAG